MSCSFTNAHYVIFALINEVHRSESTKKFQSNEIIPIHFICLGALWLLGQIVREALWELSKWRMPLWVNFEWKNSLQSAGMEKMLLMKNCTTKPYLRDSKSQWICRIVGRILRCMTYIPPDCDDPNRNSNRLALFFRPHVHRYQVLQKRYIVGPFINKIENWLWWRWSKRDDWTESLRIDCRWRRSRWEQQADGIGPVIIFCFSHFTMLPRFSNWWQIRQNEVTKRCMNR